MNICFIGKYLPIEGQVSTVNFWLARGLAEKHQVHFITNSFEVEGHHNILLAMEDSDFLEYKSDEGFVKLYSTRNSGKCEFYLPFATPFVSKLSALAIEVITNNQIDVIFSNYLEPYAVAGYIASSLTGIHHVISHAGSDIGKLARNPQLTPLYTKIIEKATRFVAKSHVAEDTFPFLIEKFGHFRPEPYAPPNEFFSPDIPAMDINHYLQHNQKYITDTIGWHCNHLDTAKFTFGYYGKMNEVKGLRDLVQAMVILKKKNYDFNLVLVTGGNSKEESLLRDMIKNANLEQCVWLLPYMPNWKIPGFIKSCDLMCYLERNFPIVNHTVIVPLEIAFCGKPMLISDEVRKKSWYKNILKDKFTCVSVESPENISQLATALEWCMIEKDILPTIGVNAYTSTFGLRKHLNFIGSWESILKSTMADDGI